MTIFKAATKKITCYLAISPNTYSLKIRRITGKRNFSANFTLKFKVLFITLWFKALFK